MMKGVGWDALIDRMVLDVEDRKWVEAAALEEGFDLAGVAAVPDLQSEAQFEEDRRFHDWVAAGAAGEMDWLVRRDASGALVRADVRRSMPWARSVLVCAVNYNAEAPRSVDAAPPGTVWIAKYALSGRGGAAMGPGEDEGFVAGSDYHEELLPRLKAVAARLTERFGPECVTRSYVDTGPILERGYAARAGGGWIGRNTCVLNQGIGSWLLLGVVVTSLELGSEAVPTPASDRCGTCTRCIDACPTDALHGSGLGGAARLMDASRCIAYLTIEKKGSIVPEFMEGMGRQIFGCDICQDVCPWNRKAPVGRSGMLAPRGELVNPSLAWLGAMDGPAFNRWFRGSPLERTRRKRILRNVAIAMGNSGDPEYRDQLEVWGQGDDAVLAEAAGWAVERLRGAEGRELSDEDAARLEAALAGPLD